MQATLPRSTPEARTFEAALPGLIPALTDTRARRTRLHAGYTNHVAEIWLADGRALVVKRGRYPWCADRYRTSRLASELVRRETELVVPAPLELKDMDGDLPWEAYWRIGLRTLEEVWTELDRAERHDALRSWGELLAELHSIRSPGHGPLANLQAGGPRAAEWLASELEVRLRPALAAHWPEGLRLVRWLLDSLDEVDLRAPREGALVHGDLHLGNVLCQRTDGELRCVGLLDLETAQAGCAELDLARLEVANTPLFGRSVPDLEMAPLHQGYGRAPDPVLMRVFRVYHLLNLGYHAAWTGDVAHAREVARLAERQARLGEQSHAAGADRSAPLPAAR